MQIMSSIEIKQRGYTQLTLWIGFHAVNVSNGNQAKKLYGSPSGWDYHSSNVHNGS
jgi:hypothetical protein